MTLAETIYHHSLHLSEPAAREVLDFIQLMEQRYGTVPVVPETGDAISPLYQALERIGFMGCVDTDEQWSVRNSVRHSNCGYFEV